MNREQLQTKDFHYHLPDEKIAKYPLKNRNESKLLVYTNKKIISSHFTTLDNFLPKGSMMVFNDTKVLSARLRFTKPTGASIEIFCLEPYQTTIEEALNETKTGIWKCMVGNLKRFKPGSTLQLTIANTILKASIYEQRSQDVLIRFEWEREVSFSSILDAAGEVPLPPYLNRETEESDKDNYQTVYAQHEGAVAAPTAGLHFVETQLKALEEKGHSLQYLTLYVGAGTFKTVKASHLVDHDMHQEKISLSKNTLENLIKHSGPIISVGTTSLRSLESLYWCAVKMYAQSLENIPDVGQNDAYTLLSTWTFKESCEYLLSFLNKNGLQQLDFYSRLFIMPSYQWKVIDGLITNFHQPGSTLLALIASWVGDDWKTIYDFALENNFRFLSYGDSSLLLK